MPVSDCCAAVAYTVVAVVFTGGSLTLFGLIAKDFFERERGMGAFVGAVACLVVAMAITLWAVDVWKRVCPLRRRVSLARAIVA